MADARGVYVTGAAGGLGLGIARRFLAEGDVVTGSDLRAPEALAGRFLPLELDFASDAAHRAAVERAREHAGGRLDVVVTHAFVGSPTPFSQLTLEEWDRLIGINLRGAMLTIHSALPHLRPGSSIVITSSIAGRRYSSVMGPHYTVARYGLIGLGRHLATELAGTGIRVNVVCPGPPDSPQMREVVSEERLAQIAASIPTRRLTEPADLAETVFFLASDEARHVHGAVFDVNGGLA
ncbi:SDR family NAD(P)-dependent oxidoreductase [Microbacterium ulmi]|uniref:SDR family oxidoreductase n=1 Tax=Microbacterium ulmi TaxID=179095 RepID=A0A7Y2M383_9MICO|nr:SDR family oxidoreductase [Microbacterium ulmi]NII69265.1 3-oxoacyl-[acyl-carrier protein] reductase [Microbacterium ulmi]NNH04944.1 SDR family oxidoreductase [Microbacterium ulmi]